jgi:hypothetical protein
MSKKDQAVFYVYAYLRAKTSTRANKLTPYYIGKGSSNRAFRKNRAIPMPTDQSLIVFIAENLTEEEAFRLEKYCIALYGRVDKGTGVLYNMTDGGEGTCGRSQTEKTKAKISAAFRGSKHPMWGKTGTQSPNWGRQHSEESRLKMSQNRSVYQYEIISPNGDVYTVESLSAFCRDKGLLQSKMSKVVNNKARHHKGWTGRIIERLK